MEGRKKVGSASSITNELFGSKESSSSGIFGAIFSPPSKVLGRESLRSDSMEKKQDNSKESWNTKPGAPGDASKGYESETQGNKDLSSLYQEQRMHPCHLSSSIYYGGQDIYAQPQNSQGSGINNGYKKRRGEKMIPVVLQEEIGGKDLSIIKGWLAKEYILVKVRRKIEKQFNLPFPVILYKR